MAFENWLKDMYMRVLFHFVRNVEFRIFLIDPNL